MERRGQQPVWRIRPGSSTVRVSTLSNALSSYVDVPIAQFLLTSQAVFAREPSPLSSPSSNPPPDYVSQPNDFSDDDSERYDTQQVNQGYVRKSVYDSRIEQILYENPDMPILITDAGKNHEGSGSFIVYTIRTGVCVTT